MRPRTPTLLVALALLAACDRGSADTTVATTSGAAVTSTSGPPWTVAVNPTRPPTTPATTTTVPVEWRLPTVHDDPGPGWMVTPEGVWVSEPVVRDAAWYAAAAGITVDEAERRNGLVEQVIEERRWNWFRGLWGFGGLWVEESADSWSLVLATTDTKKAQRRIDNALGGTDLHTAIGIREVDRSIAGMKAALEQMVAEAERWCLPGVRGAVDLFGNRLVVEVRSEDEFSAAAEAVFLDLPDAVLLVEQPGMAPWDRDEPCWEPADDLLEARSVWEARAPRGYTYEVHWSSPWGGGGPWRVTVWDGEVIGVTEPADGQVWGYRSARRLGTVERLFAIIESKPRQLVSAFYDATWGHPVHISFDSPEWADEEWTLTIENLQALDQPPDLAAPVTGEGLAIVVHFPPLEMIAAATIGEVTGIETVNMGWIVGIDIDQILFRAAHLEGPVDRVLDRWDWPEPRALLGADGERLILFLTEGQPPDDLTQVHAAARLTADGLEMIGPAIDALGFSEELPYLCDNDGEIPTDPPPTRDAEAELAVLVRWAEAMDRRHDRDTALQEACENP